MWGACSDDHKWLFQAANAFAKSRMISNLNTTYFNLKHLSLLEYASQRAWLIPALESNTIIAAVTATSTITASLDSLWLALLFHFPLDLLQAC